MPTHNFLNHHHHVSDSPKPNQKILSLFLKSIIMGFIISIFLIFLGVAAIAFLHILLLGSFLHRRRRISIPTSPTSSFSSPGYSLDQLQKHLPSFTYSNTTASKECSICLEYFKEGELCQNLTSCNHVFHASCVNQWLIRVPNCPVCRARVQLNNNNSVCASASASDLIISDEDFRILWTIGV